MQTFKDKNGELWHIELNVGSAKRVKAECNVNLIDVIVVNENDVETTVFEQLSNDIELLVDVLFTLCRNEASGRGMNAEDFASCFDGETVEKSCDALISEIINFSPPIRRKTLTKIWKMSTDLMGEMEQKVDTILESPEFESEIKSQFSKSFTDMPGSAE